MDEVRNRPSVGYIPSYLFNQRVEGHLVSQPVWPLGWLTFAVTRGSEFRKHHVKSVDDEGVWVFELGVVLECVEDDAFEVNDLGGESSTICRLGFDRGYLSSACSDLQFDSSAQHAARNGFCFPGAFFNFGRKEQTGWNNILKIP